MTIKAKTEYESIPVRDIAPPVFLSKSIRSMYDLPNSGIIRYPNSTIINAMNKNTSNELIKSNPSGIIKKSECPLSTVDCEKVESV